MANLRERLRAILGLDTKEFDRGLGQSGQKVKKFGGEASRSLSGVLSAATGLGSAFLGGLGIGVASMGLAELSGAAQAATRSVAQLGDEAKRSGLGAREFQEWKFVAEQNRISIDSIIDGFKELNLRADEYIVTGSGAASEAFERLGFTAQDLKERLKDPSALMLEIVGRLEGLDRAAQIRIADEIFGGTGGERFVELLDQGADGLQDTINKAHQMGLVMDDQLISKAQDLDRRWNEITATAGAFFRQAAVGAVGFAQELVGVRSELDELLSDEGRARVILGDKVYTALNASKTLTEESKRAVQDLSDETAAVIDFVSTMAPYLQDVAEQARAMGEVDLALGLDQAAAGMESLAFQFENGMIEADEFQDKMEDVTSRAGDTLNSLTEIDETRFGNVLTRLGGLVEALAKVAAMGRAAAASLPGSTGMTRGTPLTSDGNGEGLLPPLPKSELAPTTGRATKPAERPDVNSYGDWIDARDNLGRSSGGGGGKSRDRSGYAREAARIREDIAALEAESVALLAVASAGKEYGNVVEFARKKAELLHAAQKEGREITPALTAEIDTLAQAWATAAENTEAAQQKLEDIQAASDRGKDAMADMFGSILDGSRSAKEALADLLKEIAMVQLRKSILGLASGGGGFFGFVGSLLNVGANANGTTNWQGGLTMVGERGAELVSLPRGSQVFSHSASMRMLGEGGGAANAVTVTMDPSTGALGAFVRDQAGRVIARAAPAIVQQSVGAVTELNRETGAFR